MKSYKGSLLLSTPSRGEDFFARSVVLIAEHTEEGAFGFILNKPDYQASVMLREFLEPTLTIYEGGPVEKARFSFIIKDKLPQLDEGYHRINQNYQLTQDVESVIKAVVENDFPLQNIKVLSGYSGWSAGQLEEEIHNKSWILAKNILLDITQEAGPSLWKKIMQNMGGEHLLFANAPVDVSLN